MTTNARSLCEIAKLSELVDRQPRAGRAAGIDLVIVKKDRDIFVLYGRCPHRGAAMSLGCVDGDRLLCSAHGWDFSLDTGISTRIPGEMLQRFAATVDEQADAVCVDTAEIQAWLVDNPQAFGMDESLGV